MSVVQKNTYDIGVNNDLTNVANNVDYNRTGTDETTVEWTGSQVVVKVGSLIEANGSLYAVESSDFVIASSTGYVAFDPPTLQFYITNTTPAWDETKNGYYVSTNNRVTKWSVGETTGNYFVTAGAQRKDNITGNFLKSPVCSGVSWKKTETGASGDSLRDVAWSPELSLMAACGDDSGGNLTIIYSSDGETWNSATVPVIAQELQSVDWSPELSLFCAVGGNGTIITSSNGTLWTQRTSGVTDTLRKVYWSTLTGLFIVVGNSGRALKSSDGITWSTAGFIAGGVGNYYGIVDDPYNDKIVVTGSNTNGVVYNSATSSLGAPWSLVYSTTDTTVLYGIFYSPEKQLYASGGNSSIVAISKNPDSRWGNVDTSGSISIGNMNNILWVSELKVFIIVGGTLSGINKIAMSYDGQYWFDISPINVGHSLYGITYIPEQNKIIALGGAGLSATTYDIFVGTPYYEDAL